MVPVEVINVNILHLLIEQSNQQDFTELGKHVGLLIINGEICCSQICLKMARVTLSMKVSRPNQSGLGQVYPNRPFQICSQLFMKCVV